MRDVLGDPSLGIVDDGAVGRINSAQLERLQATQRRHVVEQVAVVRGNDGRRATQHDVTGEERLLFGQVVAQMIGGVTRRVDGHERDAVTVHVLTVAQVVDPVGQAGVAMDHLRDAQAAEALAQVRDAADVIAVAVREHDAGGLAPAPLAQIAVEIGDVLGKTDAGVDQDGISAADQIRVRPRPRHHAGVQTEHAADEVTRCRGLRKVGIDPGHGAPQDTPRKRRLTSSSAASAADEPSYTIWPLFMT